MTKSKLNYWVDVSIGVSFVLSAVSGLIFLLPVGSGAGLSSGFLGISYSLWDSLHIWSSLAMMAGVLAHLVLHWNWIVAMTRMSTSNRKMLPARDIPREGAPLASGSKMTRRRFLSLGAATVAAGVLIAGGVTLVGKQAAAKEQEDDGAGSLQGGAELPLQQGDGPLSSDEPEQSLQQGNNDLLPNEPEQSGVACPRGMINDPYPGRCRNYTDGNGDGICDYSVPGSGTN